MDSSNLLSLWIQWNHNASGLKRASLGLASAALIEDGLCSAEQRNAWCQQAIDFYPQNADAMSLIAWSTPGKEARQSLLKAGINPTKPTVIANGDIEKSPIGTGVEPIFASIAYGNLAAIEQTLSIYSPTTLLLGGNATIVANDAQSKWKPISPANWLAWSLFFQQWHVAERLWEFSPLQQKDSINRALFECVRGMLGHSDRKHKSQLDNKGAYSWIKKLVEAGADSNIFFDMTADRKHETEWFHGNITGLDKEAITSAGWEINVNRPHAGFPNSVFIKRPPKNSAWTTSMLVVRPDTPILLRSPPGLFGYASEEKENYLKRMENLNFARESIGLIWKNPTPEVSLIIIKKLISETTEKAFSDNKNFPHPAWPKETNQLWEQLSAEDILPVDASEPYCIWLDTISINIQALNENWHTLLDQSDFALSTMAEKLHGNPEAFISGIQRANAVFNLRKTTMGSLPESIDRLLNIAGFSDYLASLDPDFQIRFNSWIEEDKQYLLQCKETLTELAPNSSWDIIEVEKMKALKEAVDLHRNSLKGVLTNNKKARLLPRL